MGEFDFDEDGEFLVEGARSFVEALSDFERVDGVDGVEEPGSGRGFVGLQRPDEVHLEAFEVGGGCEFLLPFLDAVFTEEALAGGVGLDEEIDGVDLRDGHEGDVGYGPVGAGAGLGDPGSDMGEVFGDGHRSSLRPGLLEALLEDGWQVARGVEKIKPGFHLVQVPVSVRREKKALQRAA